MASQEDEDQTSPQLLRLNEEPAPSALQGAYLLVFEDSSSRVFQLPPAGDVVIGRAPSVDLRLEVASVSRMHAVLTVERDKVLVRDQGSQNGTLLNGERISSPRQLSTGDVLTVS